MQLPSEFRQIPEIIPKAFNKTKWDLPAFKLQYDTLNDIQRRLNSTMMQLEDKHYSVEVSYELTELGGPPKFLLLLRDRDMTIRRMIYDTANPVIDFRPPMPRYISHDGQAWWFHRTSQRQQQQGTSSHNSRLKQAGTGAPRGLWHTNHMLRALDDDKYFSWSEAFPVLFESRALSSLRLSNDLAVYRRGEDRELSVEFRGRRLGTLKNGAVLLDKDDMEVPWINAALAEVQLKGSPE